MPGILGPNLKCPVRLPWASLVSVNVHLAMYPWLIELYVQTTSLSTGDFLFTLDLFPFNAARFQPSTRGTQSPNSPWLPIATVEPESERG